MIAVHQTSIMRAFSVLEDPRKPRNQIYSLFDLISTAILATICGSDDYIDISFWVEENLEWLQSVGICLGGAPSHDTYERFFRFLNPDRFQECFIRWTQMISDLIKGVIALDGKTIRGSGCADSDPVHIVSAFAVENALVLGQLRTANKGGELEVFLRLLDLLDIKRATVTIDAGGCHKVIAAKVKERGGDYVLALKGNQQGLHDEVVNFFSQAMEVGHEEAGCDYWYSEERTRGRTDQREVWACDALDWLPQRWEWEGLRSIVCVKTTRTKGDKISTETRYYISSHQANAERLASATRAHWAVENNLHWHLDVTFGEDGSRVRKGHGPENLSVLRRATLNILKADSASKASLKNRRKKAGWNRDYLLKLINAN